MGTINVKTMSTNRVRACRFTDRTLKWAIVGVWTTGTCVMMTYAVWLINPDLGRCELIPAQHYLVDVGVVYAPVCVSLVAFYGRILAIS